MGCPKQSNVLGSRFCLQGSQNLKVWNFHFFPKILDNRSSGTPFISDSETIWKSEKSYLVWLSGEQSNLMFSDDPVQVSSFWPLISKMGSIARLKCCFGRFSDFKKSNIPEAENIRLHTSRVIRHAQIFNYFFHSRSSEIFFCLWLDLPTVRLTMLPPSWLRI